MCDFAQHGAIAVCRRCGQSVRNPRGGRVMARCQQIELRSAGLAKRQRNAGCVYLGLPTGAHQFQKCCGGRVEKVDVLACAHPNHETTTIMACAKCDDFSPPAEVRPRMLLRFPHGLGDHVQLTPVLSHLRAYAPEWEIHVACVRGRDPGYVQLGLADQVFDSSATPPASEYDVVSNLMFAEPDRAYSDSASTKAERCLREIFGITPRLDLSRYQVSYSARWDDVFNAMRHEIGPYVVVHGTGRSSRDRKDLAASQLDTIIDTSLSLARRVIVLDLDKRMMREQLPYDPNQVLLWQERIWLDKPDAIAVLGFYADLAIGIDSGPAKLWDAAGANVLVVWRGMHPLHYHAPASGCVHFLPPGHEWLIRGDQREQQAGLDFFAEHYARVIGDDKTLGEAVTRLLTSKTKFTI